MCRFKRFVSLGIMLICVFNGVVIADIAEVVEHRWTVSNDRFGAFALNPETDEFTTAAYSAGADVRWSRILDDSVLPWDMEGGSVLNTIQWDLFLRNGCSTCSGSFGIYGMTFCPLDDSYFLSGVGLLKSYYTGNNRLDEERVVAKRFPGLPNSPDFRPTNCLVTNVGGVYKLIDNNLTDSNGFIASGVQPGHSIMLVVYDWWQYMVPGTYTVTEVVSNNELRLDTDPIFDGNTVDDIGYILSVQPHLTRATMASIIPYYVENPTKGAKVSASGGISPDGTTLYAADLSTSNLLAIDTQIPEQASIFVSEERGRQYIQDQIDAGRSMAIINGVWVYTDSIDSDWNKSTTSTTLSTSNTEQYIVGSKAMKVTYTAVDAEFDLYSDDGKAPDPAGLAELDFWIHGGADGGQEIDIWLINSNGTGGSVSLTPPQANTWTNVVIPVSLFGVVDDVFTIRFESTAADAQPPFYLDHIMFNFTDPAPAWAGMFNTDEIGIGSSQTSVDHLNRIWFSESETDDIIWTTDGVTLNTFLKSSEIVTAYIDEGHVDPSPKATDVTNAVGVKALIVDKMGTVYWSENATHSVWKAPAIDPANNIVLLADSEDIKSALSIGSARGNNAFTIRGTDLLMLNFVDANIIYKVSMDTFDFGDFDADFDADLEDFGYFQRCFQQDATTNGCDKCDFDEDLDVDLDDFEKFEGFITGPRE